MTTEPLDLDAIRARVIANTAFAEVDRRALLGEVDRLRGLLGRLLARGGEVTTDPDGTDDSDILHLPYPPSDPNLWDRERPRAFRPDLTEQDIA